jgi:hypothetical protein
LIQPTVAGFRAIVPFITGASTFGSLRGSREYTLFHRDYRLSQGGAGQCFLVARVKTVTVNSYFISSVAGRNRRLLGLRLSQSGAGTF